MAATPEMIPDASDAQTRDIKRIISYSFAKRHRVLAEKNANDEMVLVHQANTTTLSLLEARRVLGVPAQMRQVSDDDFESMLTQHYEGSDQAVDVMDDLGDDFDLNLVAESLPEPEDLMESEDDAPVIRLINAMLTEAIRNGASDVHIEPFEKRLNIRYRIDGVMQELLEPPRAIAPLIVSRIKVMAKLDIAEKRVPQDGRISLLVAGRPVDVRVSTLPSGHGERVVMRLLDKQAVRLNLEKLGMSANDHENLNDILSMPHGIILVTGPTGSGKTTSLYAAISKLNTNKTTILTVEDPIEYYLDGIGQTQVNNKVDLDFARGLRAILRQDPDVVMVGEIRDIETAEIAVQASLTGHLVLSTLHTNSAVGAVTRLRDMGVEAFLLSSSLVGVIAQRLVRLLCNECKQARVPTEREYQVLGIDPNRLEQPIQICVPNGCRKCNHSGFQGRSGVYEVIPINEKLRNMIHSGASEYDMERYARTFTSSINEDARRRVLLGETSLEEILRVTRES